MINQNKTNRKVLFLKLALMCLLFVQHNANAQSDSLNSSSLYHHAVYVTKFDKVSFSWLKKNNPPLYNYANYVWKSNKASLTWLEHINKK